MGKKITFAVVFVLVVMLAVFLGLYFFSNDPIDSPVNPTTSALPENGAQHDEFMDEDMGDSDVLPGDTFEEEIIENDYVGDFTPSDEYVSDNAEDVVYSTFVISRVVDHTTNSEVHPRVVFGSGYKEGDSYIKFDTKGHFEMFFSGYFNKVKTGTYAEHNDIIYVVYDNGSAAEYDIQYNKDGIITYIKVNYGDYDVYFS